MVSAGDMIGASPLTSALFKDEPTIEAMNRIGIDFNAVGNHEFDEGKDELLRMQQGGNHPTDIYSGQGLPPDLRNGSFAGARFRFLAANVAEASSGRTLFPAYGVKDFLGNKVAFIGMTLEGTPTIADASGLARAKFFGASSPNTMVSNVASTRPTINAMAFTASSSRPNTSRAGRNTAAKVSSAMKPMTRDVTVMPSWAPESMKFNCL